MRFAGIQSARAKKCKVCLAFLSWRLKTLPIQCICLSPTQQGNFTDTQMSTFSLSLPTLNQKKPIAKPVTKWLS